MTQTVLLLRYKSTSEQKLAPKYDYCEHRSNHDAQFHYLLITDPSE